jgi:HAD superfamily hydrolase (TIGR01509 family)
MDGVIVDSHAAHRKAWRAFLQTFDIHASDRELDFILDGRKRQDILKYFLGNISDSQLKEYGDRKDEFFQRVALEVRPIPGILEFIRHLRENDVVLAVATSASKSRTESTLKQLHLSDTFAAVACGEDVAEGKPNPAVYQLVCQRLGADTRKTLAVEDAVSGVKAAKGAGLACIGVSTSVSAEHLRNAGADHVIRDFIGLSVLNIEAISRGEVFDPRPTFSVAGP